MSHHLIRANESIIYSSFERPLVSALKRLLLSCDEYITSGLIRGIAMEKKLVSILMGSKSDWAIMEEASKMLDLLNIPHEARALSAHRTPEALFEYLESATDRGVEVFIAAAGGAAHLPGVVASKTIAPVLGVP